MVNYKSFYLVNEYQKLKKKYFLYRTNSATWKTPSLLIADRAPMINKKKHFSIE